MSSSEGATRSPGAAVVDLHAHYFGTDLADAGLPADPRWPELVVDGPDAGRIMLGGTNFRTVRGPLWDVDQRIAELDAAGVSLQVISPVPVTMATWADPTAGVAYARAMNDSLAAAVARSNGRLVALGCLPLPHVPESIAELERAVRDLGLRGVQVGTQVAGRDWDDPDLAPLLEAADGLGAAVFIHPVDGGGGVIRRSGQPYDFGLAMITDTAVTATALVVGGVLDRHPGLRVALAHGCGTFPWAYPRLRLGAGIWGGADPGRLDAAVRRLWVDSLVLEPAHVRTLVEVFGADKVTIGTDHPFVPGQLEGAVDFVATARLLGALDAEQERQVLAANALDFLGLSEADVPAVLASSGAQA